MAEPIDPQLTPPYNPQPGETTASGIYIPSAGERVSQTLKDLEESAKRRLEAQAEITRLSKEETKATVDQLDFTDRLLDAQRQLNDARKQGASAFAREMRNADMVNSQGQYRIPDPSAPGGRRWVSTISPQEMNDPAVNEELRRRMAIRGGGGAANTSAFRLKELFGHLATGNIGGAVGELFQPIKGVSGPSGGGLGSSVARLAIGALTRPAFIYGTEQALTRANNLQLALQRTGMAGGLEGGAAREEGFRARAQAFQMGLNPFDMLSRRMAAEIANGIRSEGFKGTVATAWTDSVGDVVKDLGVDAATALESMKVAVNQLGMSVNDFRKTMVNLDNVAKDTSLSVAMVAKNAQQLQLLEGAKGGTVSAIAATGASAAIDRALNPQGASRLPISAGGGMAEFVGKVQPFLAQRFLGVSPLFAFDPSVTRQLPQLLDQLADMLWKMKNDILPEAPLETWAQYVVNSGIGQAYLPGMNAIDVAGFMQRAGKGQMKNAVIAGVKEDLPDSAEAARKQASQMSFRDRISKSTFGLFHGRNAHERAVAGNREFTNTLAEQLIAADVPIEERHRILRPLWNADLTGTTAEDVQRLRETREAALKATQQVIISLTPDAARLIQPNQTYMQAIQGWGSMQGSQRTPRSR